MYLQKYFLQNSTPEIGGEFLVFIKQFFFSKIMWSQAWHLKTFVYSFKLNFGAVLIGQPK